MTLEIPYTAISAAPVSDLKTQFIHLVTTNQGIIHKVCKMYCDSEEERRDLFQEVLLQLWKGYKRFEGKSKATTWMYRVALNTAISGFRRRKRRPEEMAISEQELQLAGEGIDREKEEKLRFMYKAIGKLSDIEKAIVMLYLEDKSYDEIAEIVGITRNHVGVKLNRIKTKLKKSFSRISHEARRTEIFVERRRLPGGGATQ